MCVYVWCVYVCVCVCEYMYLCVYIHIIGSCTSLPSISMKWSNLGSAICLILFIVCPPTFSIYNQSNSVIHFAFSSNYSAMFPWIYFPLSLEHSLRHSRRPFPAINIRSYCVIYLEAGSYVLAFYIQPWILFLWFK